VTSTPQVSSIVSARYATALIDLAEEARKIEKVEKGLISLESMIKKSDDLTSVIRSPLISREGQAKAINAIAQKAGFDSLTSNFLGVLIQNRRLYALESILKAAKLELSHRRGEVKVLVETAAPMNSKQQDDLQKVLAGAVGSDISLEMSVNPDILGGMIVTIGSRMIDDSVRRKLARLRSAMGNKANQNINLEEVG